MENETKELERPIEKLITPSGEPVRCSQCGSFEFDQGKCENCGYLLKLPPGISFFEIKSAYLEELPTLARLYPIFDRKKSKANQNYLKKIRSRAQFIVRKIVENKYTSNYQYRLDFIELDEIFKELKQRGESLHFLNKRLADLAQDEVSQSLYQFITMHQKEPMPKVLERPVIGYINLGQTLRMLGFVVGLFVITLTMIKEI